MPAMPMALSSAPIVVGMSATSSAIRVVDGDLGVREERERPQGRDDHQEHERQAGEQDVEGDLVGRLAPLGALDEGDHAVQERLTRLLGDLDDDAVREHARAARDRAAVAAGLADDRRRLAGDGRLVDRRDALDDRPVARDDLARLDHDDVAAPQLRRRLAVPSASLAVVVVRIARRASAWALPRPSAKASARLAKTTVNHSHTATVNVNQRARGRPRAAAAEDWMIQATVVMTAPISTTNMTGLRTWTRGSSFAKEPRSAGVRSSRVKSDGAGLIGHRVVPSRARLSSVTLTPGSPRTAEEAPVGLVLDQLLDAGRRQAAHARDAVGLDPRVGLGDVRVDARRGGRHRVDRDPGGGEPGRVGPLQLQVGRQLVAVEVPGRGLVRAAVGEEGPGGVVARLRRPRLEVPRIGSRDRVAVRVLAAGVDDERLGEELRADDLAVALDLRAVGLVVEDDLRDAGDDQRVGDAEQHGEQEPRRGLR